MMWRKKGLDEPSPEQPSVCDDVEETSERPNVCEKAAEDGLGEGVAERSAVCDVSGLESACSERPIACDDLRELAVLGLYGKAKLFAEALSLILLSCTGVCKLLSNSGGCRRCEYNAEQLKTKLNIYTELPRHMTETCETSHLQ